MRQHLTALLDNIAAGSVLVAGDLILDRYIIGDSDRISPEAPEPIILERERIAVPGGAANVATNIVSLGGRAHLFGIVGDDSDGGYFTELIEKAGLDTGGIVTVPQRPTTRKTRMIARGNQVLRVDHETTAPLESAFETELIERILASPEEVTVVSDYAKGVVTGRLVNALITAGKRVVADPKTDDLDRYAGAWLVTPNRREFARMVGMDKISLADIGPAAEKLMERHNIANILVTLGPDGMMLIERGYPPVHIHARTREVYDVTGAGDTVIATVAAAVAGGASIGDACTAANIAAGVVVGKHRTATVTPDEIMAYAFGPTAASKIVTLDDLLPRLDDLRKSGRTVVFTNGCFDLLHVGHITYLNEAHGLGDVLVVGLNTDRSVAALKGPGRPIIPEQERSHLMAALECVDFVVLFDEDTPLNLIEHIRPDILVKGADYKHEDVVGHNIVASYGGQVRLIDLVEDRSSSNIIRKIRELDSDRL